MIISQTVLVYLVMKRVLGISTTTNLLENSTSAYVLDRVLKIIGERKNKVEMVDAGRLHIVDNLSCYSNGGSHCADPKAGKYRCWATSESIEDPEKHGGIDEMPVIYDGIIESDVIIFSTSVRWMNHTALFQKIIERMNTFENRHSVYGEKNPLSGKKAGIIVVGQHYQSQKVAANLSETMSLLGFNCSNSSIFSWQKSHNMNEEQAEKNKYRICCKVPRIKRRKESDV